MKEGSQEQRFQKNDIFEKYKKKTLKRLDKQVSEYRNSSGSWIFLNRLGGHILDWLGWVVLLVTLYVYYKSGRWESITCNRISPEFCNYCFSQASDIVTGGLQRLNNIDMGFDGIKNITIMPN